MICMVFILANISFAVAAPPNIPAPENVSAILSNYSDGTPFFKISLDVPASVEALASKEYEYSEAGGNYFIELEYKIGDGNWYSGGNSFSYDAWQNLNLSPEDVGMNGNIDIKANTYYIRARFVCHSFFPDAEGVRIVGDTYYSPYSNVFSIGNTAYQKYKDASSWAIPELDKATEYGFITDKIKNKMNAPITREEFCEVIIKLYEKNMGKSPAYNSMTAFTDTKNPEIFKAYELGIVSGIGENKFAPNELVNREQIAAMMHRTVKVIKPDTDFSISGAENFTDKNLISPWALESVKFMNKNSFMKGVGGGKIDPKGTTTREQAVSMVVRIYEYYNK